MAVYQFQLIVIPRKGILDKYKEIPKKLDIDYKERTEYYHLKNEGLIEEGDEFKDALIQDWWSSTDLPPMEIIHQIDKKVKRAPYGNDTFINWKFYSNEVDNDASMSIDEESGKIEELRFRADLREENLKFLRAMVVMAKKYDWFLMDINGNLVSPELKEVGRLLKISNAYKFLENPLQFLTDIGNGTE